MVTKLAKTLATNGHEGGEQGEQTLRAVVQIDKVAAQTLLIPILGTAPLIVHRFSEKAKREMFDAMSGRKPLKEPKDPKAEYEAAFYRLPDGRPGVPVVSFKKATIGAARLYSQVTMTGLRAYIYFRGEVGTDRVMLTPIDGEPQMREDVVRVNRGGADLRYRPEFWPWSASLEVTYITSVLSKDSLLSLVDTGGMACGIGELRRERGHENGTYCIDPDRKVEVISD